MPLPQGYALDTPAGPPPGYQLDTPNGNADDSSLFQKAVGFAKDTLSKTAHNMNVENLLHSIPGSIQEMKDADQPSAGELLHQAALGIISPGAPVLVPLALDTVKRIRNGDYSGALANILPLATMKAPEAAEAVGEGVANAAKGTINALPPGVVKGAATMGTVSAMEGATHAMGIHAPGLGLAAWPLGRALGQWMIDAAAKAPEAAAGASKTADPLLDEIAKGFKIKSYEKATADQKATIDNVYASMKQPQQPQSAPMATQPASPTPTPQQPAPVAAQPAPAPVPSVTPSEPALTPAQQVQAYLKQRDAGQGVPAAVENVPVTSPVTPVTPVTGVPKLAAETPNTVTTAPPVEPPHPAHGQNSVELTNRMADLVHKNAPDISLQKLQQLRSENPGKYQQYFEQIANQVRPEDARPYHPSEASSAMDQFMDRLAELKGETLPGASDKDLTGLLRQSIKQLKNGGEPIQNLSQAIEPPKAAVSEPSVAPTTEPARAATVADTLKPEKAATKDWLGSLEDSQREQVYSAMRDIDNKGQRALEEHYALRPSGGSLPVGGAHMDGFFKSEAVSGFLRALRKGATVNDAVEAGNADANFAINKWNTSRKDYQVHRALDSMKSYLWDRGRQIIRAAGESNQ